MTTAPTPAGLSELLEHSSDPLFAIDLDVHSIAGANDAASALLGWSSLVGLPVGNVISPADRPAVAALTMLQSGAIDGYRAVRHFQRDDGSEFASVVWVRLTTIAGKRFALSAIEADSKAPDWLVTDGPVEVALAVTDHDWTIEHISSDITSILGRPPEALIGSPLTGLLPPGDVENLVAAVRKVANDGGGITMSAHLRAANGEWRAVCGLVVAMCQHSPPRLGLAFTPSSTTGAMSAECHRHVAEVGTDVLGGIDPFRARLPPGNFSTRQLEILVRLMRGERIQDIATALFLSPNTVRNHLSAIYRKFGVHSQGELLAALFNPPK